MTLAWCKLYGKRLELSTYLVDIGLECMAFAEHAMTPVLVCMSYKGLRLLRCMLDVEGRGGQRGRVRLCDVTAGKVPPFDGLFTQ